MKKKPRGISLDILADYYDCLTFTEKSRFRRKQIELMDIHKGEKVLDVGCGTGVLSILSKTAVGESGEVEGIDIAPRMISNAQEKAKKANLNINFNVASIDELPYPDDYFDVVIASLVFHHLPVEIKREGLQEIHRVLKDDGRFFLCDFGSPHILTAPIMYLMLIWISPTRYQLLGKLPSLIVECGFKTAELIKKGIFLEYYIITKN
ncbi:phosphoethanolamine N-methyltransferase [Peptoclostridium litorale DSM 5388]|uniref:UbiE/COQ5 methyltransferase n=1 Tax=Peptoclostridium litorale DSM 5388 TaxID=1121324 RepID=A0A069RG40_PEPLI|nr:class I SAM-dependent methyltransferase [Peptoclostridium litorale]KDR95120.1 UbiE/COQ5 methyltransferase [Peptoclostridium litorale DSM 5388]SIN74692.1 phosphoethanolamine N-methyltransferase [Peptoclostridium litorale DSM 5388]